ncbi:non-ribosomal peptide synthetase [Actinoplanes subtropicus]|uniref:non-ribosomal peptide synthetase n=1 Tax=Actinoplanes subtropicus TaxID=543632 RepID=UPI0004C38F82|nr:non-ribosomal peptide synthetase [Actinoplanes subtropicus]
MTDEIATGLQRGVSAYANKIAVDDGVEPVTYERLEKSVAAFAGVLLAAGATPGSVVGLELPRSTAYVVALLATFRVGAIALPLDTAAPAEHKRFVLEDSRAKVHVTAAGAVELHPDPGPDLGSRTGAYIIYTSGTTGRPKGTLIEQHSVGNLLSGGAAVLGLGADDVWIQLHSNAFDYSIWEILAPLSLGATLVIPSAVQRDDPRLLSELIVARSVGVVCLTPSYFRSLCRYPGGPERLATARMIIFGGEALHSYDIADWRGRVTGGPTLVNMYGITETTVHVTYRIVPPGVPEGPGRRSLIGAPLPGYTLLLLDEDGRPVGAETDGELYVGGAGVARGYVHRPELTAERFVEVDGERYFRSGDVARRGRDGELEYVGRSDRQTKIRGFRVELAEVESVFLRHEAVTGAVAAVRELSDGGRQLVAWVTLLPGSTVTTDDLLAYGAGRVPAHLVPSILRIVDEVPLTPNGKADTTTLLARLPIELSGREDGAGPEDPAERILAGVWQDVLDVDTVTAAANFFDLGGDSLQALRVIGELKAAGYELTMADLLRSADLADMAGRVTRTKGPAVAGRPEPFRLLTPADRAALPANAVDAYPMTRLQTGMLFESEAVGGDMYWSRTIFRVSGVGEVDADQVTAAWRALAGRHHSLRTVFRTEGLSVPTAVVLADVALEVHRSHEPILAPREGVPWRVHWEYDGPDAVRFEFGHHHALLDGWSVHVVTADLSRILHGATLPEAYNAMPDLAATEVAAAREKPERRGSSVRVAAGELVEAETALPAALHDRVEALARRLGVPVKSVYLGAHLALLAGVRGGAETETGVVVDVRPPREDAAGLVGLFIATVPISIPAPLVRTAGDLIGAAWRAERDLLAARDRMSTAARGLEVVFNYADFRRMGDDRREMIVDSAATEIPLFLHVSPDHVRLQSRGTAMPGDALAPYLHEYLAVLEVLVGAAPAGGTGEAIEAHRARVLAGFEAGKPIPGSAATVVRLIDRQSRRTPDKVAVEAGSRAGSYADLVRQSNAVAALLAKLSVAPGATVGVTLSKGHALIAAALGIWRAGAVYLPIDPALPAERVAYLVRDSGATVVLGDRTSEAVELPPEVSRHDVADLPGFEEESIDRSSLAGAAYLMYTSGSTGIPKGVVVDHASLADRVPVFAADFGIGSGDRVAWMTTPSFDISLLEMLCALTVGGTVVVVPDLDDAVAAVDHLRHAAPTHVQATPTVLHTLLGAGWDPGGLTVIAGGEALPPDLAGRLRGRIGAGILWNAYGPTEATIWCTRSAVGERVTIGRPFDGVEVRVLGPNGVRVPIGQPGELHIGGAGVAAGYLHKPAETAERFLDAPRGRQFRSGDLVRWLPDGDLEFLGRLDRQVKVRGFRIELGEVETILRRHPGVSGAVAAARDLPDGGRQIVAWVTPEAASPVTAEDLRAFVVARAPAYLVPSVVTVVGSLPTTANGKTDTLALLRSLGAGPAEPRSGNAPRTDLERQVAGIWSEILGTGPIGRDDDFFGVGGDSIRALNCCSRLTELLGFRVPIRLLLTHPRLRDLAERLDAER